MPEVCPNDLGTSASYWACVWLQLLTALGHRVGTCFSEPERPSRSQSHVPCAEEAVVFCECGEGAGLLSTLAVGLACPAARRGRRDCLATLLCVGEPSTLPSLRACPRVGCIRTERLRYGVVAMTRTKARQKQHFQKLVGTGGLHPQRDRRLLAVFQI